MKDIKTLANEVQNMQAELDKLSPVDPKFSELLFQMTEKMTVVDALRTREEDLNAAKFLLNKHGFVFRIWLPEDVESRVRKLVAEHGKDFEVAKIVAHVVNGDDWATMSDETTDDDSKIWAMIWGTQGDHPEWFGSMK